MEMLFPDCNYPFLVFDDFISDSDLFDLNQELNYLDKFITALPEETGSAIEDGRVLKKNKGLWLNDFYRSEKYSTIVRNVIKLFNDDVVKNVSEYDNSFIYYPRIAEDRKFNVLLSKYENGDYYEKHFDRSCYTAVLWLHKEPKNFTGGEFKFHFKDGSIEHVECRSNRLVLFPSVYYHEVTPIIYNEDSTPRYSVSTFLSL